jgi:hypothetical protein
MQTSRRTRLSVAVALSLALMLLALAAPAGAATGGDAERASPADEQSMEIWAYFDGDTAVSGGRVRVYADGRELNSDGPGPVTTFSGGEALLRFDSLPSALRIVVSGGRAGGEPVDGSLRTKVRGVTDGEIVHVNPVTTVSDLLAHAEDGPGLSHERDLTERTLGIRPILDDHDLYVTDRWFDGDRFLRWAMEQGSVGAGARDLVHLIERPGFDTREFLPPDGGNPKARAAARGDASAGNVVSGLLAGESPGATAAEVINGLLDAASAAAGLTGPEGFAVSAGLVVFKKLLSLGLANVGSTNPTDDAVSKQLTRLSAQVTALQNHIDDKFLGLQIAETETMVTKIGTTQDEFLSMLKWARDMEDAKNLPPCPPTPPTKVEPCRETALEKAKLGLIQRTQNFLEAANKRKQDATALDKALRDVQTGTDDKGNTFKRPPLIPAVREQLGKEHFWTNESSQKLQSFFRYYEWTQTNLATVLTEFYKLGGNCALTFVNADAHKNDLLTSKDCAPRNGPAEEDVTKIQGNITQQRATLPPKVLDPRVFIDRNTKRMWLTDLTTRLPREIVTNRGLVVESCPGPTPRLRKDPCRASLYGNNYYFGIDSELGWGFQNFPGWHIPTASDYQELFAGTGPDQPLARLNSLGVRQNGGPITWPYFWLAGSFYVEMDGGRLSTRGLNRVEADVFKLVPGAKGPETQRVTVGKGCNWETVGNSAVYRPQCSGAWDTGNWNTNFSAQILHYHGGMTDAQGGAYWCNPARAPSWDPAKC